MKPSELIGKIFALEGRAAELDRVSSAAARKSGNLRSARQELIDAIDSGPDWEAIEERLSDLDAGIETDSPATAEPPKPTRKPRADKGQPRPPKPNINEGRTSPLTDDVRRILAAALNDGPTTLTGLALRLGDVQGAGKYFGSTGEAPSKLETLFTEDPAAYVSWAMQREGDSAPVVVWGTADQFDQLVGRMTVKSGNRVHDTVAKFACSEYAAREAWKRLDPNADANGDRARREAGAG